MYENAQRLKSDTELILCMHYYLLYIYIQYVYIKNIQHNIDREGKKGKYVYRENGMRHISYYINMFLIYINK